MALPVWLSSALPALAAVVLGLAACLLGVWWVRFCIRDWLRDLNGASSAREGFVVVALAFVVSALVLFVAFEAITVLAWAVRWPSGSVVWLASAGAVVATVYSAVASTRSIPPARRRVATGMVVGMLALMAALCVLVGGQFFDLSWDGNAYHKLGIVQMAGGWNPVHGAGAAANWLVRHYPKGAWIRAAGIMRLTHRIHSGLGLNLFLLVLVGLTWTVLPLVWSKLAWKHAVLIGTAAALNPVGLVQAFTYMVDGQLATLISLFVGLSLMLVRRPGSGTLRVGVACAAALMVTTKFTGLVYVAILGLGLLAVVWFASDDRTTMRRGIPLIIAAVAVAAAGVGFNPYVTNTLGWGSPFYPVAGKGAVNVVSSQAPANLDRLDRFSRLGYSVFGVATNSQGPGTAAVLKIPFTVGVREIKPYLNPDTRIAGFGPLYGGALLIAVALAGALLVRRASRADRQSTWLVAAAGLLLLSVFATSEGWWARFAPQMWLIPVMVGWAVISNTGASRLARVLGALLLGLLVVNALFVGAINMANQVRGRAMIRAALNEIAMRRSSVGLYQHEFETTYVLLDEAGIRYSIESGSEPSTATSIPYTTARVTMRPQ